MGTSFSDRMDLSSPSRLQVSGMDDRLRSGLWNAVERNYFPQSRPIEVQESRSWEVGRIVWDEFFSESFQDFPPFEKRLVYQIHQRFMDLPWNRAYDFIGWLVDRFSASEFSEECNQVLKREHSGYRFIAGKVLPVTAPEQVEAIEGALAKAASLETVHGYLLSATGFLSKAQSPDDYRASIKESISAVEAMARLIMGRENATLAQVIHRLRRMIQIHPHLEAAFDKLYAWTSDDQGIRHAMKSSPSVDIEDATFMLVACSAFVSYLTSKSAKAAISLGEQPAVGTQP